MKNFWLTLGCLVILAGIMFPRSMTPDEALFNNDTSLGTLLHQTPIPKAFRGVWWDLNWLGMPGRIPALNVSNLVIWAVGPMHFNRLMPPLAMIFLGMSAWYCFRRMQLGDLACSLGAIAAALNSDFFSYACWGLPSLTIAVAFVFLAVGLLSRVVVFSLIPPFWSYNDGGYVRPLLAGACVGMTIVESFDNGVLFSLFFAAYVIWLFWQKWAAMVRTLLLVIVAAAGISWHMVETLIGTNITGISGMSQSSEDIAARWNFATQWSLPPIESLRIAVPGLFGYRLDTDAGGAYWGRVGMDQAWDAYFEGRTPAPNAQLRHSGAGHYAGLAVLVLAGFGIVASARSSPALFFGGVAVVALVLAWGRYAPAYQVFYALPFMNTIRNPVKFLHLFSIAIVILFARGAHALIAGTFDQEKARKFVGWMGVISGTAVFAAFAYASTKQNLVNALANSVDEKGQVVRGLGFTLDQARSIATFSAMEACVGAIWLVIVVVVIFCIVNKRCSMSLGAVMLFVVLTADLIRANVPWVIYYKWGDQYRANPVIDFLRQAPHEARVTGRLPYNMDAFTPEGRQLLAAIVNVYNAQWLQHQFRYFGIQAIDTVQMPRATQLGQAYQSVLRGVRQFELTNTRWIVGLMPFSEMLNERLDPEFRRFTNRFNFNLGFGPRGVVVQQTTDGPFSVIEFTGTLPRAALFTDWRKDDDLTHLRLLGDEHFDVQRTVLLPVDAKVPNAEQLIERKCRPIVISRYAPERVDIITDHHEDAVLLLNDAYDEHWEALVDGKRAPIMRANFIMRALYLEPGRHEIVFRYRPPIVTWLVSSLLALGAIGLAIWLWWTTKRQGI